jgi:SpoVK/Ycf46/Vps4 family AAA+-type ATPase
MLNSVIVLPLQRPELFTGALAQSTSGVLLFGPPGTGKTLLAKSIASSCQSTFLNITASSIYNMYVGEGEKNVKAIFTLARKLSPCIIFLDEMDALMESRDRSNASKREVINEFMTEWDGVASDNRGVMVVGATNRPFDLDDAILRRMPRRIMIDLPSQAQRRAILETHLSGEHVEMELNELAERTVNYSGSDIKNLCISAAMSALREQQLDQNGKRVLRLHHFEQALREVVPSVSDSQESIERLRQWDSIYGEGGKMKHRFKFGFGSHK